jgi:hypothetical protein
MKGILAVVLNVLVAIVATVVVVGPVAVLFWFAWRNVLAAAMLFGAFALVMFALFAAGQSGWTPGTNPALLFAIAFPIAAGLVWGAWAISTHGVVVRVGTIALAIVAIGWLGYALPVVVSSWESAGRTDTIDDLIAYRDRPAAETADQRRADAVAAEVLTHGPTERAEGYYDPGTPYPLRDGYLPLADPDGTPVRMTVAPDRDIISVPRSNLRSTRRILAFLADERLRRYTAGRELVLVGGYHRDPGLERVPGARAMVIPAGTHFRYGVTPGVYEPETNMFQHGLYRWMRDVLQVPAAERDAIYREHFGRVPEVAPLAEAIRPPSATAARD